MMVNFDRVVWIQLCDAFAPGSGVHGAFGDVHLGYSLNTALLRLVLGLDQSEDKSSPSRPGGGGRPDSAATVGYISTSSTRACVEMGRVWPAARISRGTRAPSSKLVCLPHMLCSPS